MLKIAIVIGSTRPNRIGSTVAQWVYENAEKRTDRKQDCQFELLDIRDFGLPLLDEPLPPAMGKYSKTHTKRWAEKIDTFDGFIFVTPEYNHGTSGALKNAIDFLFEEWNNKVAGFVGYGSSNGVRAVEHLRLVMAEVKVATVRAQVGLSLFTDFNDMSEFTPAPRHMKSLEQLFDEVHLWGTALKEARSQIPVEQKSA